MENNDNLRLPPANYAFNNLIQDFAEEIQGDDIEVIKHRFEGIIPSDVQTGRQIVDYLKQNDYISETNIIYLQQIIRILNKPRLLQNTMEFLNENEENVLYFVETAPNIRPGFQAIKIHVEGYDSFKHGDLDRLRHKISKIVLVPPEDVSFAGIEETNSFVITIVLPDMYCEALHMLLSDTKKHYHFRSLRKFGVDRIEVLGTWYEICEKEKERNECKLLPNVENQKKEHEVSMEENADLEYADLDSDNLLPCVENPKKEHEVSVEENADLESVNKKRLHKKAFPDQIQKNNKELKKDFRIDQPVY